MNIDSVRAIQLDAKKRLELLIKQVRTAKQLEADHSEPAFPELSDDQWEKLELWLYAKVFFCGEAIHTKEEFDRWKAQKELAGIILGRRT